MNTKTMLAALILAAAGAAGAATSAAQAHAKIESSQPKADSVLQAAPKEIRLQFNEPLEAAFSKVQLVDAKEVDIALPKITLDKGNPKVMFTPVPVLQPGQYRVRWTAMTHDGHKVKGQFAFQVK